MRKQFTFRAFVLSVLAFHLLALSVLLARPPRVVTDPLERWRLGLPQLCELDQ